MRITDALDSGRRAFQRRAWRDAHERLTTADASSPLPAEDLERCAVAAYLSGKEAESIELWTRAHHAHLDGDEVEPAARCAFWLAYTLLNRGEPARANGWAARGRRLIEGRDECVEQGYLLLPAALESIARREYAGASETFGRAAAIGVRCGDADLVALARHGQGRALLRMGHTAEGVSLLDEAMVAIEAGELTPIVAGDVYCSVIAGCLEIYDLRRAREWTASLTRWCESQPGLAAYGGQCLLRQAEVMQLRGTWSDAVKAAQRACEQLLQSSDRATAGAAYYQQGELHRLRGELARAEDAYRQASRLGRSAQPGLALLRLAQGQTEAAAQAIRVGLEEATEQRARSKLLPAYVEIMLAGGDTEAARAAAEELTRIADTLRAPYLLALSAHCRGAVLLAGGDPIGAVGALASFREACTIWQELDAPYEAARSRLLAGRACRVLADADGAALELDAARSAFEALGATTELARARSLESSNDEKRFPSTGLTARELQVLRLIATGRTNHAIAAELAISDRTVARHVSNIFVKLRLSSRAAATAYAYEHRLV